MAFKRPRAGSPLNSHKRSRGGAGSAYVVLGTELPDEHGDDGEFVPVWKQTVTDERGRRRLHGAFTGGFSAGYFNTVGSKEGWTPKTFVSSRSNRHKDQVKDATQRPEDYMDDEDLVEAAESRQLETTSDFASIGRIGEAATEFFGVFLNPEETMGVKIAQKMGWRRDQGIGRKVNRTARLGDGAAASDGSTHTFAPEDTRAMPIPREEVRRRGLGFQSEARLDAMEEKDSGRARSPDLHFLGDIKKASIVKKPTAKKSSFGVGVLNDTGSDDEDPYELGPKISFNKTLGKDKKAKKPSKFAKAGSDNRPLFISKKSVAKSLAIARNMSSDGRSPLNGFVLATTAPDLASKPRYPAPRVPSGWTSSKMSTPLDKQEYQSVLDAAKASTLDAKGRSALLGEKQLPGKSIFDFISKDARDKLANLSGKADLPQGLGQSGPEGHLPADKAQPKDLWGLVASLDKSIAEAALAKGATGWMPYAEDQAKRARYISFLELRAGLKDDLPERIIGVSTSDWSKELQEFAHAAQVFKPATGLMASRFTSSSSNTDTDRNPTTNLLRKPAPKPEDPAEEAAKLGMYGPMTRSSFAFHPSRLLCKRFGLPPPDMPSDTEPNAGDSGSKSRTEEAVSKSSMDKMMHEVAVQRPVWMGAPAETSVALAQPIKHEAVDVEKNEALTEGRAPEDVFKAIFGDDSDDE